MRTGAFASTGLGTRSANRDPSTRCGGWTGWLGLAFVSDGRTMRVGRLIMSWEPSNGDWEQNARIGSNDLTLKTSHVVHSFVRR